VNKRIDLLDLTPDEIQDKMESLGEKAYRGKQIFMWLYRGVDQFAMMTDLKEHLRSKLDNEFYISKPAIIKKLASKDTTTFKYLFLLEDNNIIESVLMKYTYGNTICLSTQVGCKMGCRFCASSFDGFIRNLSSGEMVAQILAIERDNNSGQKNRMIDNIVLMGSGEPLDNYDNTIKFLRLINNPMGLNISFRNITLSTCGIVPKIKRLAQEMLPITLSISLHAACDQKRNEIMPTSSAYSISDILEVCRYYMETTGRRVTFEYAMMKGFNDNDSDAKLLADKLSGFSCHVNIIPVNEVKGNPYLRSDEAVIRRFMDILKRRGISVTKRRELGLDIDGACGQLKRGYSQKG